MDKSPINPIVAAMSAGEAKKAARDELKKELMTVYKPGGSVSFSALPALTADHLGFVYDVTDAFVTTSDFTEGAGLDVPAGSDVAVVNVGSAAQPVYKYNLFRNSDTKKLNETSIAAAFSASVSYAVGDYCTLDGVLYRCNTAHTGAWNVAHFTAVTVIDELAFKVPVYGMGENLLDNAYFVGGGSQQGGGQFPINQRNGLVVAPGTNYRLPGQSEIAGVTNEWFSATINSFGYAEFYINNTLYIAENVVLGYTGNGYGIDRWYQGGSRVVTVTLKSNHIVIDNSIIQRLEPGIMSFLWGKTLTFSVLLADGSLYTGTNILGANADTNFCQPGDPVSCSYSIYWGGFNIFGSNDSAISIKAAKLELGDTQTLAHKDSAGNWVLNEVPDYGEELAKCQRYYYRPFVLNMTTYSTDYIMCAYDTGSLVGISNFPVTMRGGNRLNYTSVLGFYDVFSGANIPANVDRVETRPNGIFSLHDANNPFTKDHYYSVVFNEDRNL